MGYTYWFVPGTWGLKCVVVQIESAAALHLPRDDEKSNIVVTFLDFTHNDHAHKASLTQYES